MRINTTKMVAILYLNIVYHSRPIMRFAFPQFPSKTFGILDCLTQKARLKMHISTSSSYSSRDIYILKIFFILQVVRCKPPPKRKKAFTTIQPDASTFSECSQR